MMGEKKNDGGPAFPQPDLSGYGMGPQEDENGMYQVAGMTLRDWFAGQYMAGVLGGEAGSHLRSDTLARDAYAYADAMIAERNK
jgi:hypothetical protein